VNSEQVKYVNRWFLSAEGSVAEWELIQNKTEVIVSRNLRALLLYQSDWFIC
jgi:hypothetical protein